MEKEGQGSKVDKILDGLTRFSRPVPWVLSSLVPSIMPLLGGNRRKTLFKDEHDHKFPPPRTLPSLRKNGLARPRLGADGQALSSLYSNPQAQPSGRHEVATEHFETGEVRHAGEEVQSWAFEFGANNQS
jgi:hypothetical protein